jgi:uncharacterized protein YukE
MSDTEFAVVPTAVSDTGKFVQDTASSLRNGVRSADTEIAALLTTWKGNAADAYAAGWEETRKGAPSRSWTPSRRWPSCWG